MWVGEGRGALLAGGSGTLASAAATLNMERTMWDLMSASRSLILWEIDSRAEKHSTWNKRRLSNNQQQVMMRYLLSIFHLIRHILLHPIFIKFIHRRLENVVFTNSVHHIYTTVTLNKKNHFLEKNFYINNKW